MRAVAILTMACAALALVPANAEVIGTNREGPLLTEARIRSEIPRAEQAGWIAYLRRSEAQMRADRAALAAELRVGVTPFPPPPPFHTSSRRLPLDREPAWYGGAEARRIAENIVSYQTPAGGWAKNQDRTSPPRRLGQRYANDAETMNPDRANFDAPNDRYWTFVGTFDNDATIFEMRFLLLVAQALPGAEGDGYRASIRRGIDYVLAAQYPNGGWPQVYPLEGRYHDAITLNDNATQHILALLDAVASEPAFAFVPAEVRAQAAAARARGIELVIAAQVRKDGRRLGWAQQVDTLTLAPVAARNYEPAALASGETADLLIFLMRQPAPSPAMRETIIGAARWLNETRIQGIAWEGTPEGRRAIARPGAPPIWARFYALDTGRPIFGDVDKSIHDEVNAISRERRDGYSWYATAPRRALEVYARWAAANGGPAL